MDKEIVYRVEDGMDREKILCTTYQMRNFYMQFRDGFFTNLDVMNYIQHLAAAHMAKKGMNVLDVCCGRSLMLPLLRYYAKDIASYTGVDISKANIKEAMRGATAKNLEPKNLASYYPFRVGWKLGNVAEMSKVIPAGFADFVIYTSAIEHMHPTDGAKSLAECYKVMKPGAKMFLSCPNTPGNGYQTQYRAHVYEWGYDELKAKLAEIGFSIVQEVGLVTSVREMDEFYNHTAKLTPNLKVTTDDGREVPYPEISGTIILMPCGAGGTVGFAFPVKSDDGCLALFNEGGSGTDLKWDLSNAALLPGLYQSPGEQVKKAGSEEAAIMFAPSSTITVTKDKIEIKKDDTKITVTSDSIKAEKGSTTVTASSSSVDVTSPNLNINGNTKVNGDISVTGNVTISGTLTLGGIVMNTHTHVGVHGPTGGPV